MSRYGKISLSLISFQMIRVISSPSMSTTGLATLIFDMGAPRPGGVFGFAPMAAGAQGPSAARRGCYRRLLRFGELAFGSEATPGRDALCPPPRWGRVGWGW